jgi:hypothetical protein
MILGTDGAPLTKADFYVCHLILQKHGLRNPTDREFNIMVHQDPEIAEQMKDFGVWTGFLRNVKYTRGRYSAEYIASPEIIETPDGYSVGGSGKAIRLPLQGWFRVSDLLESENGLPTSTDPEMTDEQRAYFAIAGGEGRPVIRGRWHRCDHSQWQFDVSAYWELSESHDAVGIRAASNTKPKCKR